MGSRSGRLRGFWSGCRGLQSVAEQPRFGAGSWLLGPCRYYAGYGTAIPLNTRRNRNRPSVGFLTTPTGAVVTAASFLKSQMLMPGPEAYLLILFPLKRSAFGSLWFAYGVEITSNTSVKLRLLSKPRALVAKSAMAMYPWRRLSSSTTGMRRILYSSMTRSTSLTSASGCTM